MGRNQDCSGKSVRRKLAVNPRPRRAFRLNGPAVRLGPSSQIFHDGLGPTAHVQFLIDMVHVGAHGFQADAELVRGLFENQTFY